jgi:FMN-dependent NADH-azoreductase
LKIANYTFFNRVPDPVKDPDLVQLVDQIMACQGLVIATPTFNFGVPAVLKNVLDRLSYKALNPKKLNWLAQPTGLLNHLYNFYLVSCGTPKRFLFFAWPVFPSFWLKLVFWYFGAHSVGGIYGAGLNAQHLAKDNPKLLARCKKAGERYARRLLKI